MLRGDAGGRRRRAHPLPLRRGVRRRPARPAVHLQREHGHARRAGAGHRVRAARLDRPRRPGAGHVRAANRAAGPCCSPTTASSPSARRSTTPYLVARVVEWTAEICHLARTLVAAGDRRARARPRGAGRHRPQLRRHDRRDDRYDGRRRRSSPASTSSRFRSRAASSAATGARRPTPTQPDGTAIIALAHRRAGGLLPVPPPDDRRDLALLPRRPARAGVARTGRHEPPRAARRRPAPARRARSPSSRPARGWRRGRRGAGACSATRWRPGSPSDCYEGGDRDTLLAGWPAERDGHRRPDPPGSRRMPTVCEFRHRRSRASTFQAPGRRRIAGPNPHEIEGEHESDQVRRVLAVAGLALAACGGDDDDDAGERRPRPARNRRAARRRRQRRRGAPRLPAATETTAAGGTETTAAGGTETTGPVDCPARSRSTSVNIGLVTDVGKVDDKSFNQSAWEGAQAGGRGGRGHAPTSSRPPRPPTTPTTSASSSTAAPT